MQVLTSKMRLLIFMIAGILVLPLSGCSSNSPKPVGELASAETAIAQAEYSGAKDYAAVELDRANTKLSKAYAEFKKENYHIAGRLADEALVDAKLASAKTRAVKAKKAADAMEETVLLLQKNL